MHSRVTVQPQRWAAKPLLALLVRTWLNVALGILQDSCSVLTHSTVQRVWEHGFFRTLHDPSNTRDRVRRLRTVYEEWELQPKHGSSNLRIAWHSLSNLLGWREVRKTVETTLGEARRTAAAAW